MRSSISAGGAHVCALMSGGGVTCWGNNLGGQLGNGTMTNSSTPVGVSGLASGVRAIAAGGSHHVCALTSGGGVTCWGVGYFGTLGNGTTTSSSTPVDVLGLANGVSDITAGRSHTCALMSSDRVQCWGHNIDGQLGDGTRTDASRPVDVSSLENGVSAIAAGGSHTCALTTSGGVTCWGSNVYYGQLGDGTTTNRNTPVDVVSLTSGVIAISAGGSHTCASTSRGGLICWGDNSYGQLGDGSRTNSRVPVDVNVASPSSAVWSEPRVVGPSGDDCDAIAAVIDAEGSEHIR